MIASLSVLGIRQHFTITIVLQWYAFVHLQMRYLAARVGVAVNILIVELGQDGVRTRHLICRPRTPRGHVFLNTAVDEKLWPSDVELLLVWQSFITDSWLFEIVRTFAIPW